MGSNVPVHRPDHPLLTMAAARHSPDRARLVGVKRTSAQASMSGLQYARSTRGTHLPQS